MKLLVCHKAGLIAGLGSDIVVSMCSQSGNIISLLSCDAAVGSSVKVICLNEARTHLFAAFANKAIICWDIASLAVISTCTLKKVATSLVCRSVVLHETTQEVLVVADRGGDIYGLNAPLLNKQIHLGGHTASIITDMTSVAGFLVTADRDEKIRIWNFPNMASIQTYCLGHKSVVTSIVPVISSNRHPVIVSSSWDHTVKFWNVSSGSCLASITTTETVAVDSCSVDVENEVKDEEGEEEDGTGEKAYNEASAGHYPMRVAVVSSGSSSFVLVLFRGLRELRAYPFRISSVIEGAVELLDSSPPLRAVLPGLPLDLISVPSTESSQHELVVLLGDCQDPLISFTLTPAGFCSNITGQISSLNEWIREKATAEDAILTGDGDNGAGAPDYGMKKHALDRPFNSDILDASKGRGAKRSRRRHRNENTSIET